MSALFSKAAESAKLSATLVGTVVGAGFISGAELVRFFPAEGFLPCLIVAAGLFALCFWGLYRLGAARGGYAGALRALFGPLAGAVRAFVLACSLVLCASMLAGLNAVAAEGFGLRTKFPAAALLALLPLSLFSRKGVRGLYIVNLALVPLILAFLALFAPVLGQTPFVCPRDGFSALGGTVLYVGMNAFLAAPVVCDAGAKGGRGGAGCLLAAGLIGLCAAVVLGAVAAEGTNALRAEMPFLYAVARTQALGLAFSAVSACGIVTTLFSSYYPLHCAAGGRHARAKRAAALAAAFALSLCGLRRIVRLVYPLIGGAGALFFALLAVRGARSLAGAPDAPEIPAASALPGSLPGGARSLLHKKFFGQRHERVHAGGKDA